LLIWRNSGDNTGCIAAGAILDKMIDTRAPGCDSRAIAIPGEFR